MQDRLLQLYMECEVNNDESLDEVTKKGFRNIAKGLEANPKNYQGIEMQVAIECSKGLLDLKPVVLHNKINRPFVFGDAPVVFINPYLKDVTLRGVLGAQTPGLVVFYPIGTKHCIMFIDQEAYKIRRLRNTILPIRELRDVAALNKLQIHNASSSVYYPDIGYTQYLAELWKQEKKRLVDHKGKVVEAPGFDQKGELMGDIVHSFEQQIPYIPRLSFLEYKELREEDYRFSRRTEAI